MTMKVTSYRVNPTKRNLKSIRFTVVPLLYMLILVLFVGMNADVSFAAVKKNKKTCYIGKTYSVYKANCQYKSGDTKIAYVNEQGIITPKKPGKVTISIRKKSKTVKKINVTVKKKKRKPENIPVCYDELDFKEPVATFLDEKLEISQDFKNNGMADIKKIVVTYQVQMNADTGSDTSAAPEKTVTAEVLGCPAGETVSAIAKWENDSGQMVNDVQAVKLINLKIYSGKAMINVDTETGKWKLEWGTADKTPPVISGLVGKNAYNKHYKEAYRTVYKGKEKWLLKYVTAVDDRDGKVKVTVDTSQVNWDKKGKYTVIYQAVDSAGNVKKVKTKIQVRLASDDLDKYAASLLEEIIKSNWSDRKKAKAIYSYVKGNMAYLDNNEHKSWESSALSALRYKNGNCFRYYSLTRLLLTRCGIPNGTVTRWKGYGHHWWNYVRLKSGWYHLDTTPRRGKTESLCLLTSSQLSAYSKRSGNSHIWNKKWIPKSAGK